MALQDQQRIWDGFDSTISGMDGGRRPDLIGKDQCERMENMINRGGGPSPRPGIKKYNANLTNLFFSYNTAGFVPGNGLIGTRSIDVWTLGLFQGASYYAPAGGEACIVACIGGRLFKVTPRNNSVDATEIPLPDKRNRNTLPIAYFCQADKYLIIQDGESTAIIYDGFSARRASNDEVPVGTIMAYGMGRLVVIRPQSREILFGDLFGSHAGPDPGASVLKFTETRFLAEGGSATLPFALGDPTAAIFYPQQDTASGQGELLVFAEHGMSSFFLSLPREQWKDSAFQRLGLLEIGGQGHRTFVPVNGDIWFRSRDGWRSYRQARAEINGWQHLPLSTEMRLFVENDTPSLLKYGSAILFDKRLICTSTPIPNKPKAHTDPFGNVLPTGRLYHNGLIALDFDVLSAFGQSTKPAWDGHWTKMKVFQLVSGSFNGVERAFAFGMDTPSGLNYVYEISKNDVADHDGPIESYFVSRAFTFDRPYNEKRLYDGDVWHDKIRADTDFSVEYKPDQYAEWLPWKDYNLGKNGVCQQITCGGCPTIREGFYPRRSLTQPETVYDSVTTERETTRGYEFQVKFSMTGNARIRRTRFAAIDLTEETVARSSTDSEAVIP